MFFCGWKLEQEEDGSIKVDIEHAIKAISDKQIDMDDLKGMKKDQLLSDIWQKKFRSIVGSLNWLAISALPEISFRVMVLSTKFGSAQFQDIKQASKLLQAISLMDSTITFPAMGRTGSLKIRSFGDAAFGNLPDKDPSKDKVYSTLGKLVCLEGEGGATSLISWSSKKASRVAKSALAAEIMAASEACDEGHWVRHILEQLLGLKLFTLPLSVTTDSESLSGASKTTNNIQDKRSRIEVAQLREGLDLKEFELLWVPGGKQVADVLTKEVSSSQVEKIKQGKVWWKN